MSLYLLSKNCFLEQRHTLPHHAVKLGWVICAFLWLLIFNAKGRKLRNWLKTVLFVSSYSPALLVLGGVRWYSIGEIDTLVVQLVIISILGVVLPLLILALLRAEAESINFKAKKVESTDYFLLVFVASYLAPIAMKVGGGKN